MAAPNAPAKFSLALGSKKGPAPGSSTKKRPHSTLHDSDDEDTGAPQAQEVSHFDQSAGGAIDASKPKVADKGPLVIAKQENRDWRAESQRKRQKSQLPARPQANGGAQNGADDFEEEKPVYGLSVVKKTEADGADGDTEGAADAAAAAETAAAPPKPKTDEELALEALRGESNRSNLVLPIVNDEEEAFRRDYETAPDMATLEQYEAVPVEQFGAALLRGMGWKEGEAIGRRKGLKAVQPRVLEKRPALMGIGAKPDAAVAEELGAWGKGAKSRRKNEISYNPVMLVNKKTGEKLTEEELKQKVANQEAEELEREKSKKRESPARDSERRSEKSSRRNKYDDDDYDSERRDRDRRRRDKDHDRDYDSKYKSSRWDRDRDRDRSDLDDDKYRRRKHESKDYDRRDRDKDRDRDRDRDRKHRDRSRDGYDSKSSSRRDRDRSSHRHRDSDRDRRRRRDDY